MDEERKALQADIASLDGLKQSWLRQTSEDIVKAIQSAILMPFDVREAAKSYVASLDPHFKIGFFASKRKTEEERKRRLDVYLEKFQKQVQTMEWAVKDTIVRASRQAKVISESDLGPLYELSVDGLQKITTEPLSANIDTNGAYMLHYTDDVADKTKRKMRTQAMDIIGGLENLLCERSDERAAPLRKQFAEENERYQTLQAIMVEKLALESAYKQLDDIFAGKQPVSGAAEAVQSLAKEIEEKESSKQVLTIDEYRQKYLLPKAREQEESLEKERVQDSRPKKEKTPKSDKPAEADWDQQLSQAAEILRPIDGFQDAADYLVQTAERVKHKTFTIALFGAFSAGKSSFANALLGEAILPVSPNPTTAVINHIRQSTAEHPNRSTVVHMKSEQTLLDEINQSLALFDKQIAVLSELKPLLPQLESKRSDTKGHQHVSLLHTLAHAIEHFKMNGALH
ncbi:dynamin family protein [Terrilactibacillus sp. S3-3]|nr:dynamin family protein [Terrilactibacillus sp. S3-3]